MTLINSIALYTLFALCTLGLAAKALEKSEAPQTKPEGALTVLVFGDFGTGQKTQYDVGQAMAKVCRREKCDFGIITGDNFYPEGVTSVDDPKFKTHFEQPYAGLKKIPGFKLYSVLGNHDWKGNVKAQMEYAKGSGFFNMPDRFFKIPNLPSWLNIFGYDTEILKMPPGFKRRMSRKLKKELKKQNAAAKSALCDKPGWRIAFGHHPLFSTGKKKNKDEEEGLRLSLWKPITDCNVHMYFSGHEHFQEHVTHPKFDMFVQGAASQLRHKTSPIPSDDAVSTFKSIELGFALLVINSEQAEVTFYNVDGNEIYNWVKRLQSK